MWCHMTGTNGKAVSFYHCVGLPCGLCFRTVLYSKTSTTSCSASFQLHSCLDWCWQSWVYHSWNIGLWLVCHCVVWMQHIPIPFLLSPCILCSSFPSSDQSAAVGSPRGWEIPTATSHCAAIHYNTWDIQVSSLWEPRPPGNQASQTQNTDSILKSL